MGTPERTGDLNRASSRRRFLESTLWMGAVAAGAGGIIVPPAWGQGNPIKVGIATDLTGPIGFAGKANANVATMVANDINAKGGVLGRSLQLFIEDTASNESVAVNNVRKLIQRDRVVVAGIAVEDDSLGHVPVRYRNARWCAPVTCLCPGV